MAFNECTYTLIYSSYFFLTGFANPPAKFQCNVKFISETNPWPRLQLQWENPDFIAFGEVERFHVYSPLNYPAGVTVNEVVRGLHFEIDLVGIDDRETMEGVYILFVRSDHSSNAQGDYQSASARCVFNTLNRGTLFSD